MKSKLLCKLVFLLLPFITFIIYQQLHVVPSYFFAIIYAIASLIYIFKDNSAIKNSILREYQTDFQKGSCIIFAFILLIMAFPIGGYMTVPLITEHSTQKAKAVLVLASGATLAGDPCYATYQRIIHGAELVKNGQAEHLYISTGFSPINEFQEYYAVASLTQMLDIPQDKITIFKSEEIKTTETEATYARKRLAEDGISKILLTTSNGHIYRSCLTFKKAGFEEVYPAPSHNNQTTVYADDNMSMFRAAMHEWIGLVWYWINGRI